jgi:hypothetical protein
MVFPEDLQKVKMVLARNKLQYTTIKCEKIGENEYLDLDSGNIHKF